MSFHSTLRTALLSAALFATHTIAAAGSLHTFTSDAQGFDTHTYWYDDGKEVTIIDTQFTPALTRAMVEQIRAGTKSPITRVIVTHPNPDKFNGLSVLHALGAQSIASQATADAIAGVHTYKKYFWVNIAKAFSDASYPALEPIKSTFKGRSTIKLRSGETLSLFELKNPGVSTTQTVVRIDQSGDFVVGDLVHYKAHAWLEGGIANGKPRPNLAAWQEAVGELSALTPQPNRARVYGGRGEVGTVTEVSAYQKRYLSEAQRIVSEYVRTVPAADLKDPARAQAHYQALQKRFEQTFPEAKLSYLVGYGVYGLVNQLID